MATPQLTWASAGLDDVPAQGDWMDDTLALRLETMRYTKRHSEAMLARWTAKMAIAKTLELPTDTASLSRVTVRNAPDGAPEAYVDGVPIDAVIAMTDRADWSVCMVLRDGGRVGCDLELAETRSPAFVDDYLTAAERESVARSTDIAVTANAIWSAKESALKVLRTGLRRDTRTVEVTLHGDGAESWHALSVADQGGKVFPGWWTRYGDFLLTCATAGSTTEPVPLEEPPGIATGIPSHRWMEAPLRY